MNSNWAKKLTRMHWKFWDTSKITKFIEWIMYLIFPCWHIQNYGCVPWLAMPQLLHLLFFRWVNYWRIIVDSSQKMLDKWAPWLLYFNRISKKFSPRLFPVLVQKTISYQNMLLAVPKHRSVVAIYHTNSQRNSPWLFIAQLTMLFLRVKNWNMFPKISQIYT